MKTTEAEPELDVPITLHDASMAGPMHHAERNVNDAHVTITSERRKTAGRAKKNLFDDAATTVTEALIQIKETAVCATC